MFGALTLSVGRQEGHPAPENFAPSSCSQKFYGKNRALMGEPVEPVMTLEKCADWTRFKTR